MENYTTVTLFHFKSNKFWAFKQMGIVPYSFNEVQGLLFAKLMGTGAGSGFSLAPDFFYLCFFRSLGKSTSSFCFF